MKHLVWTHRISVAASTSVLLLLWAAFVSPGASSGYVSIAAAGVLFIAGALLWLERASASPSMAEVIHDVETEPKQRRG
jgi:hypothetical protein